jgi:hypothetical protein
MPHVSTIDPVEAQRVRAERLKGSRRAAFEVGVGLLGLVAAGVLGGYAMASFLDPFRVMVLNSVYSGWESRMPPWFATAFPAIVASTLAVWLHSWASRRYLGRRGAAAGEPLVLWLIGFAAGSWFGGLSFTDPDAVGVSPDPVFDTSTRWGVGAWIVYHAWWWGPTLATLLLPAVIVGRIAGRARRRRREALIAGLLVAGRRTPGEVTAAPSPPSEAADRYFGSWTVKFTDLYGQNRWVTRSSAFSVATPPRVGDTVTVLYDPNAPGDTTRILLARDNDTRQEGHLDRASD